MKLTYIDIVSSKSVGRLDESLSRFQCSCPFIFQSLFILQQIHQLFCFLSNIQTLIATFFKMLEIAQRLYRKYIFTTLLCNLKTNNNKTFFSIQLSIEAF